MHFGEAATLAAISNNVFVLSLLPPSFSTGCGFVRDRVVIFLITVRLLAAVIDFNWHVIAFVAKYGLPSGAYNAIGKS